MIVNRNIPAYLPADDLAKAAEGDIDADAVRAGSGKGAESRLSDSDFAGLLTETIQHATRIAARAESAEQLDELDVARLELPPSPTASTSAASTNWPKRLPTRGPMSAIRK